MLEGYGIFHLKGGIHSSVLSTKTFFYDIRNMRYKLIKMENQIWKILDIGQAFVLKFDILYCHVYILAPYNPYVVLKLV